MPNTLMRPDDLVVKHFRLAPSQLSALKKLGLATIRDLLYHFPVRHTDAGKYSAIELAADGERATFCGQVEKTGTKKSFRGKVPMGEATLRDKTGRMKLVWFHQAYMAKMIAAGDIIRASGTVKKRGKMTMLINPEVEKAPALPGDLNPSLFVGGLRDSAGSLRESALKERFFPVYPESRGITSRWFYHALQKLLASGLAETLDDPIPGTILKKYNLPALSTALVWIHAPRDEKHALSARKRFAFEEIFLIQLERQQNRMRYKKNPSFAIVPEKKGLDRFIADFGFSLTTAQTNAIAAILSDFKGARPMLRLLEGDVGSGKTAVAATTAYATVNTRPLGQNFGTLQVAYMCPTEILATQHFESFIKFFIGSGMSIGLITGSGCRKFPSKVNPSGWTDISRSQFLKWTENGEIPIVIGTHALIQKNVKFKHLAYVIIDEQHRFGARQRAKLVQKDGRVPHFLSMTATPIPRTLALTLYGDLDLTLLDEMPHGRKPVITEIVIQAKRQATYEKIRGIVKDGRQCYVICPRIDEPDPEKEQALIAKSVKEEAKRLKAHIFPEYEIGILHSKMKPTEKDNIMTEFASGKLHVLCATSVVEVGVNVPNATVIIVEGAERFGLAQLHQLRGRVLRSDHQAYCYLFSETKGEKTFARLKALTTAKNGFELAEIDLALRGAGELGGPSTGSGYAGPKQWGISDIGMEAIKNLKMVEAAREEAKRLLKEDSEIKKYPLLRERLRTRETPTHFE